MFTPSLGFVLLFVSNPQKSGLFYREILGISPIEESPTFLMMDTELEFINYLRDKDDKILDRSRIS